MGYAMILGIECDCCTGVYVVECDNPHRPPPTEEVWPRAEAEGWRLVPGGRRCPRCVERRGTAPYVRPSWREILASRPVRRP